MTATPGTTVTSANAATTTNTTLAVALGSTTVGDLNVVEISGLANGSAINPTMTTPAGWTKLGEQMDTAGTPASWVGVYYRVFQAGDPSSVTFSWANQGQMVAECTPFKAYRATSPIPYSKFDFKVASDVNYSIAGTTGADAGQLCYGFANRTGTAWTNLLDTARGQVAVAASATMVGRITAVLPGGTAYSKTATGSNTSVGVSWAYTVADAATVQVDADSGQSIASNATAALAASVVGGTGSGPVTWAWSKVSGPTASFSSTSVANPTFTPAGGAGTYVLRATATDDTGSASADVTITVTAAAGGGGSSWLRALRRRTPSINKIKV